MIKESLQDKILFVSHLNEAIQDKFPNVENIAYEVFEYKERGWTEEFAVVYYRGGAIQARKCNYIECIIGYNYDLHQSEFLDIYYKCSANQTLYGFTFTQPKQFYVDLIMEYFFKKDRSE